MIDDASARHALARNAMAYVLAGGRGSRLHRADRPPRQAGGLFRRQDPDHRLRALQRAQLRHPPHRRRHPVQGAQPDPPPAARLELPAARAQRELRHPAGQPARVGDAVVRGHRRRGVPEHRHHRVLRARIHGHPGRRPRLQDGLRADARSSTSMRAPTSPSAASRCRAWRPRASASCMSTSSDRIVSFLEKPKDPPGIPGNPDDGAGQHGHLRLQHRLPVRPAAPRRRRPRLGPRFRQGHHPLPRRATARPWRTASPAPASSPTPRPRPTGATSARSTPTGRPISTSPTSCPALDLYDQRLADLDLWRDHPAGQVRPRRGRPARRRP